MNREIEFRVWCHVYAYKLVNHKWVGKEMMCNVSMLNPNKKTLRANYKSKTMGNTFQNFKFDEVEIMQYTGLKDMTDKKIFEGDIVRIYELDVGNDDEIYEIRYFGGDEYPAFDFVGWEGDSNGMSQITQEDSFSMEVIGNVYENPELI